MSKRYTDADLALWRDQVDALKASLAEAREMLRESHRHLRQWAGGVDWGEFSNPIGTLGEHRDLCASIEAFMGDTNTEGGVAENCEAREKSAGIPPSTTSTDQRKDCAMHGNQWCSCRPVKPLVPNPRLVELIGRYKEKQKMVRAKFKVDSIGHTEYSRPGPDQYVQHEVILSPVCGADDEYGENTRFHTATPSGSLKMVIDNPDALAQFHVGDEFYVDFTKCEAP